MAKLREIEILAYILQRKSVTSSRLAHDLGMNLELSARWLAYLHRKGWLSRQASANHKARFFYDISPKAKRVLREVKSRSGTWEKIFWFGLGSLAAIALTEAAKRGREEEGKSENIRER